MRSFVLSRSAITVGVAALLAGCGGNVANVSRSMQSGPGNATSREKTFKYTGSEQLFTVPNGVKAITVIVRGASAPRERGCTGKSRGGRVHAQIAVTPGQRLYVFVGSEFGFNGGAVAAAAPMGFPAVALRTFASTATDFRSPARRRNSGRWIAVRQWRSLRYNRIRRLQRRRHSIQADNVRSRNRITLVK
jgi:hypothetical protein